MWHLLIFLHTLRCVTFYIPVLCEGSTYRITLCVFARIVERFSLYFPWYFPHTCPVSRKSKNNASTSKLFFCCSCCVTLVPCTVLEGCDRGSTMELELLCCRRSATWVFIDAGLRHAAMLLGSIEVKGRLGAFFLSACLVFSDVDGTCSSSDS